MHVASEMKQRQIELTKVEEELKKRKQEILDLQLRLHEAEKTLVRKLPYGICMECECLNRFVAIGTCCVPWPPEAGVSGEG